MAFGDSEVEMIDGYRPRIMQESATTTQLDNPDEFPVAHGQARGYRLPDPAVGGVPSSGGNRIGWSDGIATFRLHSQPFTGRIYTAPTHVGDNMQGAVGQSVHANRLQAGVRSQQTMYNGSLTAQAETFVGSIT